MGRCEKSQISDALNLYNYWTQMNAIVAVLLAIVICGLLFLSVFHIPLPAGICDRRKIQVFELLMRIFNEHLVCALFDRINSYILYAFIRQGDFVEYCFGPVARNKLTRWLCALPFWLLQFGPPKWCTIRRECISGVRCRVYNTLGIKSNRKVSALPSARKTPQNERCCCLHSRRRMGDYETKYIFKNKL